MPKALLHFTLEVQTHSDYAQRDVVGKLLRDLTANADLTLIRFERERDDEPADEIEVEVIDERAAPEMSVDQSASPIANAPF